MVAVLGAKLAELIANHRSNLGNLVIKMTRMIVGLFKPIHLGSYKARIRSDCVSDAPLHTSKLRLKLLIELA
jgi:hypothetical protein